LLTKSAGLNRDATRQCIARGGMINAPAEGSGRHSVSNYVCGSPDRIFEWRCFFVGVKKNRGVKI